MELGSPSHCAERQRIIVHSSAFSKSRCRAAADVKQPSCACLSRLVEGAPRACSVRPEPLRVTLAATVELTKTGAQRQALRHIYQVADQVCKQGAATPGPRYASKDK
jgi:hypothetical protein